MTNNVIEREIISLAKANLSRFENAGADLYNLHLDFHISADFDCPTSIFQIIVSENILMVTDYYWVDKLNDICDNECFSVANLTINAKRRLLESLMVALDINDRLVVMERFERPTTAKQMLHNTKAAMVDIFNTLPNHKKATLIILGYVALGDSTKPATITSSLEDFAIALDYIETL